MINNYIPKRTYAIVSGYKHNKIIAIVAGAQINDNNTLTLEFPKNNPFSNGDLVTLHLDDRTGVDSFDISLKVHRCSYKAYISNCKIESALAIPVEYNVIFKHKNYDSYMDPTYNYPIDNRSDVELLESPISQDIEPDGKESENKVGVWCTPALERPHTTVMAFLSTTEDDIFLISHRDTFKSKFIHKNCNSVFAIDHRASYHFVKAYDWNYTIIRGKTYKVSKANKLFNKVQQRFVEKNPWEEAFFTDPKVEMYHIKPDEIICPESI